MSYSIRRLIFDSLELVYSIGMIGYVWHRKWKDTHPPEIGALTETDAEVQCVYYKAEGLRPREKQRAEISVQYQDENGKTVTARLSTVPIRYQLEMYAPEIQKGAQVRIRYEKKRPHIFYFADPRYAVPEVSGQPRHVRIGWLGLILLTVIALAGIGLMGFILYLEWTEYLK